MKANFFQEMVEYSPDLISVLNREGICTYANTSYQTVLGYPPRMLVNQHFAAVLRFTEESKAYCLEAFPLIIANKKTRDFQIQLFHEDGRLFTFNVKYMRIEQGQFLQIVLRDISHEVKLEHARKELLETNQLLVETLDYTGVGILIRGVGVRTDSFTIQNRY